MRNLVASAARKSPGWTGFISIRDKTQFNQNFDYCLNVFARVPIGSFVILVCCDWPITPLEQKGFLNYIFLTTTFKLHTELLTLEFCLTTRNSLSV